MEKQIERKVRLGLLGFFFQLLKQIILVILDSCNLIRLADPLWKHQCVL